MKRRDFITTAGITGAALSMGVPGLARAADTDPVHVIKPNRLTEGATIGLIAPAGFIDEDNRDESVENLEKLGFKVIEGDNLLEKHGYLAGTDEDRADDVMDMFDDDKVDGIVCARGGYGCSRMLPHIDWDVIRCNPKPLIGYSDITSLHYGIFAKTGLICFHGPVGISTFNDYSVDYFKRVLMEPEETLLFKQPEELESQDTEYALVEVEGGTARGRLIGGNLSVVVSLIGTEYDVDSAGKIIFLEDVREEPYRIDRMLTQMRQSGKFDTASGVACGVFRGSDPNAKRSGISNSFSLMEVMNDRLGTLDIPVVYGLSFGHITNKYTVPVGAAAELDADEKTLKLLEPAVV